MANNLPTLSGAMPVFSVKGQSGVGQQGISTEVHATAGLFGAVSPAGLIAVSPSLTAGAISRADRFEPKPYFGVGFEALIFPTALASLPFLVAPTVGLELTTKGAKNGVPGLSFSAGVDVPLPTYVPLTLSAGYNYTAGDNRFNLGVRYFF